MSQFDYKQHYGRNLPHIQPPDATLFVTFRLAGSIPQSVLDDWRQEKKLLESTQKRRQGTSRSPDTDADAKERLAFQRRWFGKFEAIMHAGTSGPLWLKNERLAEIVHNALLYRDGKVYRLDASCVMPNHVHAVFAPLLTESAARKLAERARRSASSASQRTQTNSLRYRLAEEDLSPSRDSGEGERAQTNSLRYPVGPDDKESVLAVIMHSLKGYTARQCNTVLGRSGGFWQHESFDHIIRDEPEFARVINYVLNNPLKEGIVDRWPEWKWNYCRPSLVQSGLVRG
jgi:REP element-mobilizing transposase RayT